MPTVLLVDDSATDRKIIGGILERNGFTVRFAESGAGALKQLRRACPELILTDMQMPEMDGLDLVKAIRAEFAEVPIILITGHGSESLAAQALHHGAASYVPKSQIAKLLVDSVRHVLELARGDNNYRRLIDQTKVAEFQFELPNDPSTIEPLITLVQQMMGGMQVCDAAGRLQVGVALEHAILNGIYHGNLELSSEDLRAEKLLAESETDESGPPTLRKQRLVSEPYASRRVLVRALITRDEARLTVRDQGPGFHVQDSLNVSLSDDESAGRGLVLMWALMDKVIYNKTGNEVTLVKRREPLPLMTGTPNHGHATDKQSTAATAKMDGSKKTATKPAGAATAPVAPKREKYGELIPLDGSKTLTLFEPRLSIGRDRTCDLVLPHSDVSHEHCLLYMYSGWWYVKDLKSANGTRINKVAVDQKRIAPGAILSIAGHQFEVRYSPWDLGAEGITPPIDPF